ncbi:hypothetical protein FRC04_008402 [Tulasnella sp. 424]|nr:hypothetical protein FRC04_008402 [Tulasnella sp. 424]KAG8976773.1 hypothetical protein FRC05_003123 [Tulasnella sp. 425]
MRKLKTWLVRSKAAPLWVSMVEELEPSPYVVKTLAPLLVEHVNHWGRFWFISGSAWGLATFIPLLENKSAPLLKELCLAQSRPGGIETRLPSPISARRVFDGLKSVPKLTDLDLWSIPVDWSTNPFKNLKSLALAWMQDDDKLTVRQFLDILGQSPQLEQLSLAQGVVRVDDMLVAFSEPGREPPPLSLPNLQILRLFDYHSPITINLTLRLLHAPNVERMFLQNLDSDEDSNPIDFSETFEFFGEGRFSSFTRLTDLELRRVSCGSKEAWKSFSKLLTRLDFLSLTYVGSRFHGPDDDAGGELLYALLPPEPSSCPATDETTDRSKMLCPNLRSMSVSGCREYALVNFLRCRSSIGCGPTLVEFGGESEPSGDVIKELAEKGVRICWQYDANSEIGSESGGEAPDDDV